MELAKWLHGQKNVYYALRLKKSNYIEIEKEMWRRLKDLGLSPGMSLSAFGWEAEGRGQKAGGFSRSLGDLYCTVTFLVVACQSF